MNNLAWRKAIQSNLKSSIVPIKSDSSEKPEIKLCAGKLKHMSYMISSE